MTVDIGNPSEYRAALYIRLSKEDENEGPSESVSNQKSLLEEFVERHCLTVYSTYIDDGWSGTNFDRPDFNRMISDIEAGYVNMVITKDLSRLGRDYIMTGHYMERYFPEKRVRYISLLDGIDTGVESSANDITPFRAIMNDMYAKDISKKIKSVKRDKQRKGEFIGGKAVYGYKMHQTEKNKIVIDENAAPIVRRIFNMASEGASCRQIAVKLNDDGIPPPSVYAGLTTAKCGPYSKKWSSERIADMLKNETYIGNMVQGKSEKISYKSKKSYKKPRDLWVVVAGTHEPLVSEALFRKVQILLESRRSTRCRTYDYLLKGLIFCRECGYPLAVINRKNASGEDVLYFVCRTYQRFTKSGICTSHTVKEQTVNETVIRKVSEVCGKYLIRSKLKAIAESLIEDSFAEDTFTCNYEALRNEIENMTVKLDKIYMDHISGLLEKEDFERIYNKIKNERNLLEEDCKLLENKKNDSVGKENYAEEIVDSFMSSAFEMRDVLFSLVERIELSEEKEITVKFRFGTECVIHQKLTYNKCGDMYRG
ncbi:MAG: resolvase [Ruminococcaceae bacterium]|nr:resolvase [Oscillospiraceae bacterium]